MFMKPYSFENGEEGMCVGVSTDFFHNKLI